MNRSLLKYVFGIFIVFIIFGVFTYQSGAQEAQPPPEKSLISQKESGIAGGAIKASCMDDDPDLVEYSPIAASPQATGGPDNFGYTWDDTVSFNWMDATNGSYIQFNEDDAISPLIDIGFDFKFYENSYSQLYFTTNGLISFDPSTWQYSNRYIPLPTTPNNFIAPFWDDLCVSYGDYNNGAVYYKQGGTAPNRYFIVEWHEISRLYYTDKLTFEVILHENGDIVMQYLSLAGTLTSTTVGIEDGDGADGLQYLYNSSGLSNNLALRFYRPAPAARVKIWPGYYGQFTNSAGPAVYQVPVSNTGDLGADTYDVTITSPWPVVLYQEDGVTPLSDTDASGTVDTGLIPEGEDVIVIATVTNPGAVSVGDSNKTTLTIKSALDPGQVGYATLQSAVPAPFVQSFIDRDDNAVKLNMVQPAGQLVKKNTASGEWGLNLAVTETQLGFFQAWRDYHWNGSYDTYQIEYAIVDRFGEIIRPESVLTDLSGVMMMTYDYTPAAAAAPDGRIGVVWERYLYNHADSGDNSNIFFAVLDAYGNIVVPPINLTNNPIWGYG